MDAGALGQGDRPGRRRPRRGLGELRRRRRQGARAAGRGGEAGHRQQGRRRPPWPASSTSAAPPALSRGGGHERVGRPAPPRRAPRASGFVVLPTPPAGPGRLDPGAGRGNAHRPARRHPLREQVLSRATCPPSGHSTSWRAASRPRPATRRRSSSRRRRRSPRRPTGGHRAPGRAAAHAARRRRGRLSVRARPAPSRSRATAISPISPSTSRPPATCCPTRRSTTSSAPPSPPRDRGFEVAFGGSPISNVVAPAPGPAEGIGVTAAIVIMLVAFGSVVAMGLPIAHRAGRRWPSASPSRSS